MAIEESTWDALFAAEDGEDANNDDSNGSIDFDAEAEPDHDSHHHHPPRKQDSLDLDEEEEEVEEPPAAVLEKVSLQSLNFGFNEGFRMNSDQSLGLSSEPSNGSTSSGCCIAEEDGVDEQQDNIETSSSQSAD